MPEVEDVGEIEQLEDTEEVEEIVEDESTDETEEDESTDESADETEETEEEPTDEKTHPFDRPTVAQLKAAYPDIFKKFPGMQDMYFREKEYTKLFATIDEAKEASENNIAFVNIQEDIMKGTGEQFFSALKEADTKSLERFSGTLMSTLAKVDLNSFYKAANPLIEDVVRRAYDKGTKEKNENLQNSALFIAEFFFGDESFATGKKTSVAPVTEGKSEVETDREKFNNERYTVALSSAQTNCKSSLVKLIDNDKFDPQGALSPFIKKTIINSIIDEIGTQLTADKAHMRYMDTLWANAKRGDYRDLSRIESAYLARAKDLVSSLRVKYISDAMGKRMTIAKGNKQKLQNIQSRKEGGSSGTPSKTGGKTGRIDYSKTSDDDILNDRITYH